MKKCYESPETEILSLIAEKPLATQGGVMPVNDGILDGETGLESSIFP